MRRRRRRTGLWLPNHGTAGDETNLFPGSSTRHSTFRVESATLAGGPLVGVIPLLFDTPVEPSEFSETTESLSIGEFIKNAYFLKRVVGSIFVTPNWVVIEGNNFGPPGIQCTVGMFVARAGDFDDESGAGFNEPIGGPSKYLFDYNPDSRNCIREPWLWRRSWWFGNPYYKAYLDVAAANGGVIVDEAFSGYAQFPPTNAAYGSVADGPKVDAKTKRRVTSDDRLWGAVAVRTAPYKYDTNVAPVNVDVLWDLRFFGTPIKDRNRGNF